MEFFDLKNTKQTAIMALVIAGLVVGGGVLGWFGNDLISGLETSFDIQIADDFHHEEVYTNGTAKGVVDANITSIGMFCYVIAPRIIDNVNQAPYELYGWANVSEGGIIIRSIDEVETIDGSSRVWNFGNVYLMVLGIAIDTDLPSSRTYIIPESEELSDKLDIDEATGSDFREGTFSGKNTLRIHSVLIKYNPIGTYNSSFLDVSLNGIPRLLPV